MSRYLSAELKSAGGVVRRFGRRRAARLVLVLPLFGAFAAAAAGAAELSGVVFEDRNGDATRQASDPGLSGWTVYIDSDRDGVLDNPSGGDGACTAQAIERCTRSDATGAYRLTGLEPGIYAVREVPQPGWAGTTPAAVDVLLRDDTASVTDVHFGNFLLGAVEGLAFEDANGNANRDPGEAAMPGWTIFADDNLNSALDEGEIATATGAGGTYTLRGLAAGTRAVRARPSCGFRQTFPPPPGRHAVAISASGLVIRGRDFGGQRPAVLPGDGNGDGRVSAADLIALLRILAGGTPAGGADANQDGSITATDLAATAANLFDCADFTTPVSNGTPTASATATRAPPVTSTHTASATPLVSSTATATGAASPTATPSRSPTASATASLTAPATPSATATASFTGAATPTATTSRTPTATLGAPGPAEALAGSSVAVANGMGVIPAVITALVSGLQFGEALVYEPDVGGAAGACPLGGTATRSCTTGAGSVTLNLALDDCRVATASGSVAIDPPPLRAAPEVTLQGTGFCPTAVLPPWMASVGLEAVFRDPQAATLLTATADLTGTINPQIGGSCRATGAALAVTGTLRATFGDGISASLTFNNIGIGVSIAAFNAQCVPVNYTMTLNGPATIAVEAAGAGAATATLPFEVMFTNLVVKQDATSNPTKTEIDGGLSAGCAGGMATLDTVQPLEQLVGASCPGGGKLKISAGMTQSQVFYLPGGKVGIDANADDVSEKELMSCHDPSLLCSVPGPSTPTPSATRTSTPGVTPTNSSTATVTATRTATGTATRIDTPGTPNPTPTASATRSATPSPTPTITSTPIPTDQLFCDSLSGPALIPDNNPTGINNTIVVSATQAIADLNVRLNIAHTWVGDLRVALTHVESGRTVLLLDRPGVPAIPNGGCGRDDVAATFDDASTRAAEDRCAIADVAPLATIDGSVKPSQPLSAFAGESIAGTWRLNVSDRAQDDTGALLGWCLAPNSLGPVVTAFTCLGAEECVVVIDEPFTLPFSFVDANGDATAWHMRAVRRSDGFEFAAGDGPIETPSGGTIFVNFNPFACPSGDCPDTDFDYFVTVTDQSGRESPPQRLRIIVTLFGL